MLAKIKNIAIYLVLFFVGALIGFWLFDHVAMPIVIGSGKAYPVPNLIGMTSEAAEHEVLSKGFRFKITREEFSTSVPANRVLTQIPKATSLAKKNRTIRVVVSKGGIKAVVPDVSGKLLRQAQIALEASRLLVGEIEGRFSDSVKTGVVISTVPEPGDTLPAETAIKIIVSKGSETATVTVPNLVGMQSDEACKTLHALGLKCAKIKRRIPTIAEGEVFKQEPAPGIEVYRGNAVRIMVNELE